MYIVFSDLDGTLLHPHTYSFDAAHPALDELRRRGIPLVLSTSKTRPEVEFWRERLGIRHPFIVENGAAIYIPRGYFPSAPEGAVERDGYHAIELGSPYPELVETLRQACRTSGCEALGFHDMTVEDIAARTLLSPEQAVMAKQREYDEPFEILGTGSYRLLEAIEAAGKRWTRGDRFYHITGPNSKADAVGRLSAVYRRVFGDVAAIGVGNGHNDVGLLRAVDIPVIVRGRFSAVLKEAVRHAVVTRAPGPHGWNETVLELLAEGEEPCRTSIRQAV